jgi:hypothetical protein
MQMRRCFITIAFQLCFVIRKVQENQMGLKLNGAHQLLAYTDDVNLLGYNIGGIVITFKLRYTYFFSTKSFNVCMLYFLVLSYLPYFDFPLSSACISMDQQKLNKLTINTSHYLNMKVIQLKSNV